jgi:hypothetical protein
VLVYARGPEPERRAPAYEQPKDQSEIPEGETGNKAVQTGPNPRPAPRRVGALIGAVAPGQFSRFFAPGTALRVPAGAVVTFQMHYTATGEETTDRTRIGLHFADAPPQQPLRISSFINGGLRIPPGAADHQVTADATFLQDVTVYSILPHTHLRGRSWEYRLTYPDGREEVVLSVPKYDFNWQTDYVFASPLRIPKGARLTAVASYDNSAANRANPDPTQEVLWGDQTWEEMCYTALTYAVHESTSSAARER